MNCKRAKTEIALWVGQDLDEHSQFALERHLAECPDCRSHRKRMQRAMNALQGEESVPAGENPSSENTLSRLWPEVAVRSASFEDDRRAGRGRFNGWVPATAVMAACILLTLYVIRPPAGQSDFDPNAVAGLPVSQATREGQADAERTNAFPAHREPFGMLFPGFEERRRLEDHEPVVPVDDMLPVRGLLVPAVDRGTGNGNF